MMRFYFMGMQGSFISTQKPSTTAAAAIVHLRIGYAHLFEKAGKFGILQFKKRSMWRESGSGIIVH